MVILMMKLSMEAIANFHRKCKMSVLCSRYDMSVLLLFLLLFSGANIISSH